MNSDFEILHVHVPAMYIYLAENEALSRKSKVNIPVFPMICLMFVLRSPCTLIQLVICNEQPLFLLQVASDKH
jgi:hypothetical protein